MDKMEKATKDLDSLGEFFKPKDKEKKPEPVEEEKPVPKPKNKPKKEVKFCPTCSAPQKPGVDKCSICGTIFE